MRQQKVEILVGFIILAIAITFSTFAYKKSGMSKSDEVYTVYADFENVEGINEGADVKIGGIDVGYVQSLSLDTHSYVAKITLNIEKRFDIPKDSSLSVTSSGLLGGKYLNLTPGGSPENIKDGEKIRYTNSAINLESLINKVVYSLTTKKD